MLNDYLQNVIIYHFHVQFIKIYRIQIFFNLFTDIEKKFPEPKVLLNNIFALVSNETKNPHSLHGHAKQVQTTRNKLSWSYTYNIVWPEKKAFTAVGHSKASTSHSAALKCLYWLHLNGRIKNRTPVIYQKEETRTISNNPEELNVDKNVLERINIFLDNNEKVSENLFQKYVN